MFPVRLSVVIAAHDAAEIISFCLEALERQSDQPSMEIILADSSTDGTIPLVRDRFPHVQIVHEDRPVNLPELRARGIARARGRIIAILDPYSIADERWSAEVVRAHETYPNLVIGGSVDLFRADEQSLTSWATYINEYGMFMPPAQEGEVGIVPGSNVSYKRECLYDGEQPRYAQFWKTFVNEEVVRKGSPLRLEPRIRVSLNKPVPFWDFFRTRVWHGRCFAGMRVAHANAGLGWLRAASAPMIPLVLWWRWARVFWPKHRHRGIFLATLPAQFALFGAWAWGELQGYLFGVGDSCRKLFY